VASAEIESSWLHAETAVRTEHIDEREVIERDNFPEPCSSDSFKP